MTEITTRQEVQEAISAGGWSIAYGNLFDEWDIITFAITIPTGTVGGWVSQQLEAQLAKFSQSSDDVSKEVITQATAFLEDLLKKNKSGERDIGGLGVKAGIATYNRKMEFSAFGKVVATTKMPNNHQPYIGLRVTKALPTGSEAIPAAVHVTTFTTNYATAIGGIGGYDLKSPADRAFAFDYDHSGKVDHLALYRPGTGTMWILKNDNGFSPVYQQGDPGAGIGSYDLRSPADRAFAFDYDHSGKLDHIVLYRPGTGTMWILKNSSGKFSAVYAQGDPGSGIGGFSLKSPADRAFAFDYDHSGKLDHIALYRPGTGAIWILKNNSGNFSAVYAQGSGIGGYDLKSPSDKAFAFDYDHSGKLDHIALYRPGTGTMWILKNNGGTFSPVYQQGDPGSGIGGYDLKSPQDEGFAFDYDQSGRCDHIALYRPGTGTMWILQNNGGTFSPVYQQGDPGSGIGGFDLKSPVDKVIAFDFTQSDTLSSLFLFRGGQGAAWILTAST